MAEVEIPIRAVTVRSACKEVRKILLKVIYTIDGKYGDGEERRRRLGASYDKVQAIINILYSEGDLPLS